MIETTNHVFLGSEQYTDSARLVFADGDFGVWDDTDEIDPAEDLEWHYYWESDFEAGTLALKDGEGNNALLLEPGEPAYFGGGIDIEGPVSGVQIADDIVQFPALGPPDEEGTVQTLEFRASESDWDQMWQFDRHSNSDYSMSVFVDGDPDRVLTENADSDILREGEEPYPAIRDQNETIDESAGFIDFGADLEVSTRIGGVEVEFVGGELPSPIYDDGEEVFADANGIDFQDDLFVVEGDNNIAEVNVDHSMVLEADANETVGGDWTFGGSVTFENHVAAEVDHAETADNADTATYADEAGDLAGAGRDELAEISADETITGDWTHDATVSITNGNELRFGGDTIRMRYSDASGHLTVEDYSTDVSVPVFRLDSDGASMPEGATINGSEAASHDWVENSANAASAQTVNNTVEGNLDVGNADTWDGYEISVDEQPQTDQYFRIVTADQ